MGAKLTIGGYPFPLRSYTITEDSTPLAANDTSGSPGVLSATISAPDPDLEYVQDTGMKWLMTFGRNIMLNKDMVFTDTRWGTLPGTVTNVTQPSPGEIQITATTDLNKLNTFNLRALPYVGTLGGLIRSWMTQNDYPGALDIESSLDTRPINAPGWRGELYYHLKMLAQAHEFDLSLVNGVVTVRRLRQRSITVGAETSLSGDLPIPQLARGVEVYQYNNRAITDELVYPAGGWTPETEVLNVNAGESATYTLPLSASVSSIQQPVMLESVSPGYSASSVYTVVANDGLPVPPGLWEARGGSLTVTVNLDTKVLKVRIRGADKIPTATGDFATNFSIALASDTSGSRYSTLRIVGTGVAWEKEKLRFRTGVGSSQTGTSTGVTIDNPFLSNKEQASRAGVRAAVAFSGAAPSINRGTQRAFASGATLGNLSGARVFDRDTARPYRLRSAQISPSGITADFDDDLTFFDVEGYWIGQTYGDVETARAGITYRDDYLAGLRGK